MKKTMLTYKTLDRFESEYTTNQYTADEIKKIEQAAYVANMNACANPGWTENDIFNDFLRVLDIDNITAARKNANSKKLDNMLLRLKKDGFLVRKTMLHNVNGTGENVPVLVIDTNYSGLYPTLETMNKIGVIRNLCKNKFYVETRGHYTAVFVREWLATEKHL